MGSRTTKTAKLAMSLMEPGEHVVASAKVDFKSAKRLGVGLAFGAIGAVVTRPKSTSSHRGGQPSVASMVPTRPATWILTDRRMIFCRPRPFGLGEPIAFIDCSNVDSIAATKAKVMYGKLRFTFTDGSAIDLDLLADGEVDQINAALAGLGQGNAS